MSDRAEGQRVQLGSELSVSALCRASGWCADVRPKRSKQRARGQRGTKPRLMLSHGFGHGGASARTHLHLHTGQMVVVRHQQSIAHVCLQEFFTAAGNSKLSWGLVDFEKDHLHVLLTALQKMSADRVLRDIFQRVALEITDVCDLQGGSDASWCTLWDTQSASRAKPRVHNSDWRAPFSCRKAPVGVGHASCLTIQLTFGTCVVFVLFGNCVCARACACVCVEVLELAVLEAVLSLVALQTLRMFSGGPLRTVS